MSKKSIHLDDKKIKKSEFYKNKKVNSIDDIDVYKMFKKNLWQKEFKNSRMKYFIGYNDNDVIRPLCVRLP